jgi:hypothetical protein
MRTTIAQELSLGDSESINVFESLNAVRYALYARIFRFTTCYLLDQIDPSAQLLNVLRRQISGYFQPLESMLDRMPQFFGRFRDQITTRLAFNEKNR